MFSSQAPGSQAPSSECFLPLSTTYFYCRTPLPSHCSSVPRQTCPFQDLLPTSLTDPSLTYCFPCSHTLAFNTRLCNCVLDAQSTSPVKSPEHAAPHQVEPSWDWPTLRQLNSVRIGDISLVNPGTYLSCVLQEYTAQLSAISSVPSCVMAMTVWAGHLSLHGVVSP